MATCFCLRCFWNCFEGSSQIPATRLKDIPAVVLDTYKIGQDVVIVKSGTRICGTGGALANAPVVQNKSYFEFKIQQQGAWGVGLASYSINLDRLPLGNDSNCDSWILRNDGKIFSGGVALSTASKVPDEGDVIGVAFDHIDLVFFLNGEELCRCFGAKGILYPVVYVDDGAILDCQFSQFTYSPTGGFQAIMVEQTLL